MTSPAISRPGVDGTAEEANVKPGNSAPHALPKCSRKSATDFSDLNSIEAKKELVRLTLEKVKDVKEKMANSGLTNGHSTPPPEGGTLLAKTTSEENKFDCNGVDDGIYASQRLKKSAGGLTENGPTAKVNQKSSSGKTTVLFAEEPRTGLMLFLFRGVSVNNFNLICSVFKQTQPTRPTYTEANASRRQRRLLGLWLLCRCKRMSRFQPGALGIPGAIRNKFMFGFSEPQSSTTI